MSIIDIGKGFIESWMLDECVITRDPHHKLDDVLDEASGLLIAPDHDSEVVYTGKCTYGPLTRKELTYVIGEKKIERKLYRTLIPSSAVNVNNGDIFVLTYAYNDQHLLGVPMLLSEIDAGTHMTYRKFLLVNITEDRSNPYI